MRNLAQYPLTHQEILDFLERMREDVSYEKTGGVGDMRPMIVEAITKIVERADCTMQVLKDINP